MPYYSRANTPLQKLKEQLQAVDVLFEVRDARLPQTSMHPKTRQLFGKMPRLIVLCKEDLADPVAVRRWLTGFVGPGTQALALSLKANRGKSELLKLAYELCRDKLEARARKGLLSRPLRAAVVGLPNVGKSSLINWLVGRKKAAVANTPGVTRANAWIRLNPQIELLDTPGMLPMAAFGGAEALKLALCNVLPGEHYDVEEIALYGLELLLKLYPHSLETYGSRGNAGADLSEGKLACVATARCCLRTGGTLDLRRAAGIFLSEFRSGKLGRFVLDTAANELEAGGTQLEPDRD
jgi:ribosome biogenesis GTPase A